MNTSTVYFVYPGDLNTPTGGYHYDRRLIQELRNLNFAVQTRSLPDCFPFPDTRAHRETARVFAALPEGATVIVDGLAFGVLDELAVAESRRLRLIALCHHPLALESGLSAEQQQTFTASEKQVLRHSSAVVVTSHNTHQLLVADFDVPEDRIVVALPGTDRTSFAPCDGDPPRLLTVGSLIPRKGHDVLIDALALLTGQSWSARFVGSLDFDRDWVAGLHTRVNRLQLTDRIDFVGPLDNLQSEYQHADLFVLPSRFEGYGMVFAEALAAGLPIVAARAGAVPDVVPDTAGILVPPDDPQALSDVLGRLFQNQTLREKLQHGARAAAVELPSWRDSATRVAQRINEVERL